MHDAARLFAALDATWPAARSYELGPWLIRDGQGGGQRVSAAVAKPGVSPSQITAQDIAAAQAEMRALGQEPIFQIRPQIDDELDQLLEDNGYFIRDPVVFYQSDIRSAQPKSPVPVVEIWPPLAMTCDVWQDGGIGPGRVAVMGRAPWPKTSFLARKDDRPAGAAFVAIDADIAMIHAIEVPAHARRKGAARDIFHAATGWAQANGATTLALVVTRANLAANALYDSLHMIPSGGYHYRVAQPQ